MQEDIIKSWEVLAEKDGERVIIEGTYTLYNPFPSRKKKSSKKKDPIPYIVQIVMDAENETGPFLGAYWSAEAIRSEAEMARFDGKMVRLSGIFHLKQPPQPNVSHTVSAFGGACLLDLQNLDFANENDVDEP